jgi:hypothetical protein
MGINIRIIERMIRAQAARSFDFETGEIVESSDK